MTLHHELRAEPLPAQRQASELPDLVVNESNQSAVPEAPGPAALTPPAASGLAVLVDIGAQFVQFTVTLGLALSLAGLLCFALMASSHQFSESVRSSRKAVRANSIQTLAEQLQSVVGKTKPARPHEKMVRELNRRSLKRSE